MIIAFETKSSPELEKYLKEYQNPELMLPTFRNLLSLWMYGLYFERKVYRVDNVVIFSQKGFIEQMMGYALLILVGCSFASVFYHFNILLTINLLLMIPCMLFLSPKYHLLSKIWKIKKLGHKEKIGFVSNGYLINKLLYVNERKNGTG